MGVAEYFLAVPRGPEIFRRFRDARYGHVAPRSAVEHLNALTWGEAKGVGGVAFDDNLVRACGIGQSPGDDVDLVDFVAVCRWHSHNPADEFRIADPHRLIGLRARHDAFDTGGVADRGGDRVRVTACHGPIGEM